MSKVGRKLISSARQAAMIARGDMEPAKVHVPAEFDVKGIRQALKLSQDDFASEFGFTINQIRDWEQGRARPLGGVRAYLLMIQKYPEAVRGILRGLVKEDANGDDGPVARAM